MRIWMLASLLFAVTAIGGDRGMETSSRFFDRVIATSPRSNPFNELSRLSCDSGEECCKVVRRASRAGIRALRRMMFVMCRRGARAK